jgi:hypothetical protein
VNDPSDPLVERIAHVMQRHLGVAFDDGRASSAKTSMILTVPRFRR